MRRSAAIVALERQIERIESKPRGPGGSVPTGVSSLDTLLPGGGLPRGQVVEWLGPRSSGKTSLLRAALASLRATGESIALIDPARSLYAPDWTGLIAGEGRFWVIRPPDPTEAAWCADLILRSGAFGAVALLASRHTGASGSEEVDPLLRRGGDDTPAAPGGRGECGFPHGGTRSPGRPAPVFPCRPRGLPAGSLRTFSPIRTPHLGTRGKTGWSGGATPVPGLSPLGA